MTEEQTIVSECSKCGDGFFTEYKNGKAYKTCPVCRYEDKRNRACEHGIRGSRCHDCDGIDFCEHDIRKYDCIECNGSGRCEHGERKERCEHCGGASLCEHGIERYYCIQCKGNGICEHNMVRHDCRDCNGSSFCIHNLHKHSCIICNPKCACQLCHFVYVGSSRARYKPYCFTCYYFLNSHLQIPRKYKLRENHMIKEIKNEFQDVEMIFDKSILGGCSRRRPDVFIDKYTHVIIIECDENQHLGYNCENKRLMQLFKDCGNRPLVVIRFNPDSYMTKEKEKVPSCFNILKEGRFSLNKKEWNSRFTCLKENIREQLDNVSEKNVNIIHLFYDEK